MLSIIVTQGFPNQGQLVSIKIQVSPNQESIVVLRTRLTVEIEFSLRHVCHTSGSPVWVCHGMTTSTTPTCCKVVWNVITPTV